MLDLSERKFKNYQLKLEDGKVLNIKYPTKALLDKLVEIKATADSGTLSDGIVAQIYGLLGIIINSNKDGIAFSKADIEKFSFDVCMLVIDDYINTTVQHLGE